MQAIEKKGQARNFPFFLSLVKTETKVKHDSAIEVGIDMFSSQDGNCSLDRIVTICPNCSLFGMSQQSNVLAFICPGPQLYTACMPGISSPPCSVILCKYWECSLYRNTNKIVSEFDNAGRINTLV